ncbi:MAG: DUF2298 domain-containing protein [Anaerolineae bacterium]
MIWDWLMAEGGAILSWWLISTAAGIAILPLLLRFLRGLSGGGYALARTAGIMLTGYLFWLLNNLGILRNTPGDTLIAWLIVLVIGLYAYFSWREREPLQAYFRRNSGLILLTEVLFIALFIGWSLVRAHNPDLTATEKPMEMAFLSAVRRSAQFPPHDPWFSGYAISYYHFGYILIGTIANLSGVTNGMAFNLGIALIFALTGVGAFGVAFEMVAARGVRSGARIAGLLALMCAIILGNLGTVMVEIPYHTRAASEEYLRFMNLEERDSYTVGCPASGSIMPSEWCYWWWFRYSRVVRDLDLSGRPIATQPITEFPQFSFILADMHPHVLAMPFVMLALGLGLNLVVTKRRPQVWEMLLYGVFIGGMVFLNSWDAIFIGVFVGAEALRRLINNGTGLLHKRDFIGIALFAGGIALLTAVLYLPFFIGFRSQAGGFLPNAIWKTQFQQYFLQFAPFVIVFAVFLITEWRRAGERFNLRLAAQVVLIGAALLVAAMLVLGLLAFLRDDLRGAVFQAFDDSGGIEAVLLPLVTRHLHGIITYSVIGAGIFMVIGRLFARRPHYSDVTPAEERQIVTYSASTGYALLLIGAAAVLTLAPDFVYLRDGFGVRINTIFKLWFQAWLIGSVALGYAIWSVLAEQHKHLEIGLTPKAAFAAGMVVTFALGLVYPVMAIYSRAWREGGHDAPTPRALTLDGGLSMAQSGDEYAAIQCLAGFAVRDDDVVAEATKVGLAYNGAYGRVSALTGIPTLLGWDNHQNQWRGSTFGELNTLYYVVDGQQRTETRAQAISTLYRSADLKEAAGVVDRYGITYIFLGQTEQFEFRDSPEGLAKFDLLAPVCQYGNVRVFRAAALTALAEQSVN